LGEAISDVDRLIGIFNALLRLAELDSGVQRAAFRHVELAALVGEVADLYEPPAEEKEQSFNVDVAEHPSMTGDPLLIAQAVGNLLDNAIKYTPRRGSITVRLATGPEGTVAISVADTGPGISPSERERTVERFYRGDASRGTPGVGLGLSLVSAVARVHDGQLVLGDNNPGLLASLVLPGDASLPRHAETAGRSDP
jgi:signal transduction histidine kinase